ncbi:hypothetical protein RG47T_2877 [Mucilaginibacter polytrichastri]|uniref:Uncharacterized protein n=1 Tax=Mucilaginibacter polytrichastri TaxID=1302689 RepID=A0A1Q6A083_9SPHI|nr:hypothetical protein RG47T_2877 [Mucilaginibacter polytrichastri]
MNAPEAIMNRREKLAVWAVKACNQILSSSGSCSYYNYNDLPRC